MRVAPWPRTHRRKSYCQKPSSEEEEATAGVALWRPPWEERGARPPRPWRTRPRPAARLGPMRRKEQSKADRGRKRKECRNQTQERGLFIEPRPRAGRSPDGGKTQ